MLNTLCQNYSAHLNGTVEAVLVANQGQADEVQPFRVGGNYSSAGFAGAE